MGKGILYGIGVGPGDPELMTLKAVRLIRECDMIAVPGKTRESSVAYEIASGAVEHLAEKACLAIEMPMTKDAALLRKKHLEGCRRLTEVLDTGKNIAFLTLGDPTVYATYFYLHRLVEQAGYQAVIISGIPSFCAAAARLDLPLGEGRDQIHIIPSSYDLEAAADLPGTKVFMKAGKQMGTLKEKLLQQGGDIAMVERCTMAGERVFRTAEQIPEDAGYYSIVIARETGHDGSQL